MEFPNGISCSIYISSSLYQFQVHGRAQRRTGVYDQMEQLFTSRKFHFCSHRSFRFFFLNGKRPKKVGPRPFSRLEFVFHLHVSRSLYQFQVHGKKICRAPRRTGVYDQMEQLFTNRKFHFCYHRNFRVFFVNGKRPRSPYGVLK